MKAKNSRYRLQANQILGTSFAKICRDGAITIEDGFIVEISENIPLDPAIKNRIICPCLMDAHTHLFLSGTPDMTFRKKQQTFTEVEIQKQIKAHIQIAMSHGVLAVRDMGDVNNFLHKISLPKSFQVINTGPGYCVKGRYGQFLAISLSHMKDLPQAVSQNTFATQWIKIIQSDMNSLTNFK